MLEELDVSLNEITPIGISYLAEALPFSGIKILNISKNLLGDESLMIIADKAEGAENMKLERLEINSSRVADAGDKLNKINQFMLTILIEQQGFSIF